MLKAVILAAGKGTRMKSDLPKVVHTALGKPLVYYAMKAAKEAGAGEICAVVGYGADMVKEAVKKAADELEIYTSGATNILKYPELGDINKTSEILEAIEEKKMLTDLIDETLSHDESHGIQVYIGDEAPVSNMKDLSIVTATYELEEGAKGTIGIIGPKRMDYKKVVTTLQNLTEELDVIFKKGK